MNFSTPWFKNLFLKSPGLKIGVEKLRVEMSFNPYKEGQKILHDISIKMAIEQDQSGFLIGLLIFR